MVARIAWLRPLSKFFLEVSPFIAALLIAVYLAADMSRSQTPTQIAIPVQVPELFSGEELTEMVKDASIATVATAAPAMLAVPAPVHAATPVHVAAPVHAAAAEPSAPTTAAAAQPPEQPRKQAVAARERPARPKPQLARHDVAPPPALAAALTPPSTVAGLPAAAPVAALPPPPPVQLAAEPVKEEPTWYGKTWSTVSDWSGKAARTARLDTAAEVVVAAPVAVARAGKRALDAVGDAADAVLPSR